MAKTSLLQLALSLLFFFSLAAASSHHHKHAPPNSRLWLIRKLWSRFAFSSAQLGHSSFPLEAYKKSARSGNKAEVNHFHSRPGENAWWSSIAAAVPSVLPGPVIAPDPNSAVAADADVEQRTLQNRRGAELDNDISDPVPTSSEAEGPMQAVQPMSPPKPASSQLQPLLKARPFGLKDAKAVGSIAPSYGGFTAVASKPIWTSFGFNYAGQETAKSAVSRTESVMKARRLERESKEVASGVGLRDKP